jgi:hypothetical protein
MQRFVQGRNPGEHVWDNASDAPTPAFLQVRFLFMTLLLYALACFFNQDL